MVLRKLKPCKTCGDPSYLWAHGNCKNCDGMLRAKAEIVKQQEIPVCKPFKINKVSTKQAKLNAAYNVLATQFKKDNPYCKACLDDCTLATTDIHHMQGRGEYLMDTSTWLPTCRSCHNWIELNVEKAKELGLSKNRLDK